MATKKAMMVGGGRMAGGICTQLRLRFGRRGRERGSKRPTGRQWNIPVHWRLSFKQHAGSFGGLLTAKEYGD
jgi:hypothetical protein